MNSVEDVARYCIRFKLRQDFDTNSFKTDLNTVTENVLDDFLRYIEDEASGFLVNELTYKDGLVKMDKVRKAVREFIDFNLRENDINEYDFNESTDSRKHPYWMDDDVGFDIPDLDDRDIYGDEYDDSDDFDESMDVNEARQMHTWNVTYTGKGNKAKTHMVDAPDAYEANRKARRELGISYTDIDDVTMVETLDNNVGKYNKDYYTADKLIDVLKSYVGMIDNDNGKYPTAVLSDIKASIKSILKRVER